MKLNKIRIRNFRSISDLTLDVFSDITLIVGKNNIGKSNVLRALDLIFSNYNVNLDSKTLVDDEDFRAKTSQIKIMLTFNNIKNYVKKLEKDLITETSKKRKNKEKIFEIENKISILTLYNNQFNEISIELQISRNPLEKKFDLLNPTTETRESTFKKKKIVRYILDNYHNKVFEDTVINNPKWFKTDNYDLVEDNDKISFKDKKNQLENNLIKKEIHFDKIIDIEKAKTEVIQLMFDTQKFLYVPAYRGGKNERDKIVEKLFDIIIDDLVETKGNTKDYDIISNAIWGTGRNPTKEYLNKVIEERVQNLKTSLKDETVSTINEIAFKPYNKKEIRRKVLKLLLGSSNIILDDGIETSFESKGTGLQSSFMITLMKALSDFEFQTCYNILIVIEEPEAFTHPQLTREIIDKFTKSNDKNKYQFIITTHSPIIIDFIDSRKIQRLIETNNKKLKSTIRVNAKLSDFNNDDWSLINRIIDINNSEIVFSDYVIFVEGEGDKYVFQQLLRIALPDKFHKISIISMSGRDQIYKLQKLLTYYNIKWIMISDKDGFIKKKNEELEISLSNLNTMLEKYQIGTEYQQYWERVLDHPNVDKIILKSPLDIDMQFGELLKNINNFGSTDEIKREIFAIASKKINEQFVSDEDALIVINEMNKKMFDNNIPLYSLPADLESMIVNSFTFQDAEAIWKKYFPDSYSDFVQKTDKYSDELKINELRKLFGSKCYQLFKISAKASQRKKPHFPIEIISSYINRFNPDSTKIINDFPILDNLKSIIERII